MEIRLAGSAGYCFGVQRALDKVYEQIRNNDGKRKIYTYGPIIHNSEVVRDLEEKGVFATEDTDVFRQAQNPVAVIRSHGVERKICEDLEKAGAVIEDATCPFVKKIHKLVEEKTAEGRHVIVIGDKDHPEVKGIVGWSRGKISVIGDEKEAEAFEPGKIEKLLIVSQTTFNKSKFEYLVEIIREKGYDTDIINTICNATSVRQEEAADIARWADTMIVIGDRASSNTQKLYEICRSYCKDTYHIQTVHDLTVQSLQFGKCVGITAGASTPNHIIQEVFVYVRGNHFQ